MDEKLEEDRVPGGLEAFVGLIIVMILVAIIFIIGAGVVWYYTGSWKAAVIIVAVGVFFVNLYAGSRNIFS